MPDYGPACYMSTTEMRCSSRSMKILMGYFPTGSAGAALHLLPNEPQGAVRRRGYVPLSPGFGREIWVLRREA